MQTGPGDRVHAQPAGFCRAHLWPAEEMEQGPGGRQRGGAHPTACDPGGRQRGRAHPTVCDPGADSGAGLTPPCVTLEADSGAGAHPTVCDPGAVQLSASAPRLLQNSDNPDIR